MRDRIWDELAQSKFHLDYLCLYVKKLIKQNKRIDNAVLFTSLLGIFGWYNLGKYSIIWSFLLAAIAIFRMMKSKFFPTEQEISTLNSVCEFYIDHVRKLEILWLNYERGKYTDDEAEFLKGRPLWSPGFQGIFKVLDSSEQSLARARSFVMIHTRLTEKTKRDESMLRFVSFVKTTWCPLW